MKAPLVPSLQDLELIAWHHLINDPYLTTYTMVNGKEVRKYVNPKLAWKRAVIEMQDGMFKMSRVIIDLFVPSIAEMAEKFQEFANSFKQLGLMPSFEDDIGV